MDLTTKKETVMPALVKAVAPTARPAKESELPWGLPVATRDRRAGGKESPDPASGGALPWEDFAETLIAAEVRLACLERDLASYDMRPHWICRSDFQEAVALASLCGDVVAMEDFVQVDAGVAPQGQTSSWLVAKAMLSLRRHISLAGPAKVLTVDGILDLERRLAGAVTSDTAALEGSREPVRCWLDAVEALRTTPLLPAAAIALRAWRRTAPLASYNDEIGLLLSSVLLWHWGKTKGLTTCPAAGLQAAGLAARSCDLDDQMALGNWIALFCRVIEASAIAGQESLHQMTQGRVRAARLLKGHRSNSRLPRLVSLFFTYPVMTARSIYQRLGMTAQGTNAHLKELIQEGVVVEITGKDKNRVYRLA